MSVDETPSNRAISRRGVLLGAGGLGAAAAVSAALPVSASAATSVPIVVDGVGKALIVTPDAPDSQVTNAAADLVRYIKSSTTVELRLCTQSDAATEPSDLVRINIGFLNSPVAGDITRRLQDLGSDGFVIAPTPHSVTVIGPTPWGTRFGVYEFLERYVGVRWLLPGDLGEDVPIHRTIRVSGGIVVQNPAFTARLFSPYRSVVQTDDSTSTDINRRWGAYLRGHYALSFHHNLWTLFPVLKYKDTHPEFYPIRNGVTVFPADKQQVRWQPRFSAPGIADAAAVEIIAKIEAAERAGKPLTSFSLGINDAGGFSEDDLEPGFNTIGARGASTAYYTFVNEVVERVTATYPDMLFGLLAYDAVIDPPAFPLHDNVVPFYTHDRMSWLHRSGEDIDRDLAERWTRVAKQVGWYDYRYGIFYGIPRIDDKATRDAYRFAQKKGVQHVVAEVYAGWAEGAKAWTYSRQVWNPSVNTDDLIAEWCERAVGHAAADDLIEYHRVWQRVWNRSVGETDWYQDGLRRNFFGFNSVGYMNLAGEAEVTRAKALLGKASAKATTQRQKDRAALMSTAFELVEASILSYPRAVSVPRRPSGAQALLDTTMSTLDRNIALATNRQQWIDRNKTNPYFNWNVNFASSGFYWTGWNFHPLWALAEYLRDAGANGGSLRSAIENYAASGASEHIRYYARLLLSAADGTVRQLGENMSFDGPTLDPWLVETALPLSDPARLTDEVSLDGGQSLRLPLGFGGGGVSQRIDVGQGPLRAVMPFYTARSAKSADATIIPTWIFYNSAGVALPAFRGEQLIIGKTAGKWAALTMTEMVPETAVSARLYMSFLHTDRATSVIYVDAARFEQISHPSGLNP